MRTVFVENRERKKDPASILVSNSVTVSIGLTVMKRREPKEAKSASYPNPFFLSYFITVTVRNLLLSRIRLFNAFQIACEVT